MSVITACPLPFLLIAIVAAVLCVLLWRLVLSTGTAGFGLWLLAAHGDHTAVASLAVLLLAAALTVFAKPTGRRGVA
ncbi:hypothetical protein GCM10022243_64880 [Saccharothrix violaceirubra]|uniref:Membrane protein YdbS with pleckstrin-like domain n=1 Tax=Saccharothrix violaceirubra TaxID=413306 RepID=A0A7W7T9P3_9PSEU|nr:hypothetical protein [Saccharothrix violaceirubra]MBB4969026.1 membrane protein YdbS with pleckstrin-like domain [Saccharothrix violaceirubra]